MIPHIFVSSTIADLHHLRDAIRDAIGELAYVPVLSEYGDVGYLPSASAEDSCYLMLEQCQLAVVIIGKRYGSIGRNDLSVTHNEFRTARDRGTPVITLVDDEVISFKRVYDIAKDQASFAAPGMDSPQLTFAFLDDVVSSAVNNGILPFSNVADARLHLKRQLAHLFGDLLRNRLDPVRAELKDIISELKTLRHELRPEGAKPDERFLRAIRFIVDDARGARAYRVLLALLERPVDTAVPEILAAETFEGFVRSVTGHEVYVIHENDITKIRERATGLGVAHWRRFAIVPLGVEPLLTNAYIGVTKDKQVIVNGNAYEFLKKIHRELHQFVAGDPV